MKHRFIASLFTGLFFLLFTVSCTFAQAQEQNLAEWYYAQENWDNATLDELNFRASTAYKEITGSRFTVEELMTRNEFYWFFPDFQANHPNWDMACNQGTATTLDDGSRVNSYYLAYGIDTFIVAMIFHENLHSDVVGWVDMSNMAYLGQEGLMTDGFETNLSFTTQPNYPPLLRYFDEAFVDLLRAYIMREAGFESFDEYGYSYEAGVDVLKPYIQDILDSGVTIRDLYEVHTNGDLETILSWLGEVSAEPPPQDMTKLEYHVALGWDLALLSHFSVWEVMNAQAETYVASVEASPESQEDATEEAPMEASPQPQTISRATCGMDLWFSPQQYEQANNEFSFPSGVWRQNEWGNWVIEEEDYYAVIDRQ